MKRIHKAKRPDRATPIEQPLKRPPDPDCQAEVCDDNCRGWGRCYDTGPQYDEDAEKIA